MHVLYIHQYFATPHGSTGTRSYEFARRWIRAGHRITMLTSTAQLRPADVPGGDLSRRAEFDCDGIRVIALPVAYSQKMGKLARIVAFLRFMWRSSWTALSISDVDIVYATSTPLTVAVPAMIRRLFRRTPYVFEVRDLWPAIPHQLGYLKSGLFLRLLQRFERCVYRSARAVVALSPGMRDGVRGAAGEEICVLVAPNCSDTDRFHPDIDGRPVRRERGWDEKFICIHVGAIGMSNGLDFVIRAADQVRDDPAVHFVLVGDGRERPALERMATERGLKNVEFTGDVPKSDVPRLFAAADLSLVVFAAFPILEHNSANKLFDSLAAGRPVLLNYGGWQREILESEGAGLGCRQGDLDAFVARLLALKADPARCAEMGRRARMLAETRFSRDRLASEVLALLESVVRPASAAHP